LVLHPHLRGLVRGGGLTAEGQWRAVHNGLLLPARVVMAVLRGKLLAAIRQGVAHGRLTLPAGKSGQQWENLLNKLGRTKWHVHIRERSPHGDGVLTYRARYRRGVPLANQRLVSCEHGVVTFRYRVNGEAGASQRSGLLTGPIAEFLRRYLQHVPGPGTKVVRCYGLYAPTKGAELARCRGQLGQGSVVQPPVLDWQTACRNRGDDHPDRCPVCGRVLVCLGVILPARIPPRATGLLRSWHEPPAMRCCPPCGGGVGLDAAKSLVSDPASPPPRRGAPPVLATTAAVCFARPLPKGVFGETPLV
jgi:Putative transposase